MTLFPYLHYVIVAFDRHYFGYFHDRLPILALTTPHKTYLDNKGIPYIEIEQREFEKKEYYRRKASGEPHLWELEAADQKSEV